ncbi:MAG: exodeoxyribonuclease V alpha subunit, partial [Oceanospirillaceae bacterium]
MTASVIVENKDETMATGIATKMATNTQLHTNYVGLEAIDVFLATQLCQSLNSQRGGQSDNPNDKPNDKQSGVLQHLIMALSKALRNGHSCLPLADIAGQTYWSSAVGETRTGIPAAPVKETTAGYTFASFEVLME